MKLAAKLGGTDIAGASVFVPSSEFYVYWRTDTSSDSFYGFKIASVTGTTGEATGTIENLPNYTATELTKGTYPESPNHGSYGNNINLLWKCSGTTSGSKTASWERIQDQDISVAKAQADAARTTANTAKNTADTAKVRPKLQYPGSQLQKTRSRQRFPVRKVRKVLSAPESRRQRRK